MKRKIHKVKYLFPYMAVQTPSVHQQLELGDKPEMESVDDEEKQYEKMMDHYVAEFQKDGFEFLSLAYFNSYAVLTCVKEIEVKNV